MVVIVPVQLVREVVISYLLPLGQKRRACDSSDLVEGYSAVRRPGDYRGKSFMTMDFLSKISRIIALVNPWSSRQTLWPAKWLTYSRDLDRPTYFLPQASTWRGR